MAAPPQDRPFLREQLKQALQKESKRFEEFYLWICEHMPPSFFEEVRGDNLLLITHNLMGLNLQEFFSHIHLKGGAISLCLESTDADLRILKHFRRFGIKDYRAFVSNAAPPLPGTNSFLRIAITTFTGMPSQQPAPEEIISQERQKELLELVRTRNPQVTDAEFKKLIEGMNPRFLKALGTERLIAALDMFFRAETRDHCQYEVKRVEDWEKRKDSPSLQIVLAWRNVPKHGFLYRLAKMIHRHSLAIKRVNTTYIDPYSSKNVLIMSLGLHGISGKAAWEEADVLDFLRELVTLKYFEGMESIESLFVDSGLVRGNIGHLIKSMISFVHQVLVHEDVHMYSLSQVEEGFSRHPELIVQICEAFEWKFNPEKHNLVKYETIRESLLKLVNELDTGQELNDKRRKNILKQALNFVHFTQKTNFYRNNKTALSFRLDPNYLSHAPYDYKEKFPELPYAIFFMKGMYFIGFHVRFKDLSRGGLRTVFPEKMEQLLVERNNVFAECYGLAYTQQKKNKDIPEGGAKAVILLEPYERLLAEGEIYAKELEEAGLKLSEIQERTLAFDKEHKLEYLHQSQRAYVESFLTLVNCEADGTLKAKDVVDYWKKPEYIYLGPDENMHNEMIVWIANFSKRQGYKPGSSFISSKPGAGINHKEYGVTSLGVNVYVEEVLRYLGIDPTKDPFTIKMSGGPDGDVAGNEILNLARFYPKTAKLVALTDVSGTIFDPQGLDLPTMEKLFHEVKAIRFYPPEKLSEGGFLLDLRSKREQTAYAQQTLCWRKKGGKLIEEWLSGNEMNHLFRSNVHQTKADIFVPGGGRPRTLNDNNYKDYLDAEEHPTSKAVVEGANLYITPWARKSLEKLQLLIIKDSSANKGGVICSSFEVLCGLCLSEEEFIKEKPVLMKEILEIIRGRAKDEAQLLLRTHKQTGSFLTDISDWISEKINSFTYELLDYLVTQTLSNDPEDPLIRCLLNYCPPLLRSRYQKRILLEIPDIHKKAIIACYISSRLVYSRGLDWAPSVVDVLPLIAHDPAIIEP
ncbi:MAG: NAD-glutamate dehydrogenase [Chlamydiales bacterium]|nr:NAD-glutamate dehydrogenase [Chlamydiales bacterium]